MAKPLTFSVGIPTFNQAEYLEATILSLLNQTRPPDEIVISDHFSTDSTPEIIAKYSGHVRGVKPPVGSNVGAQWDFTISCLSGDWITLFSSDDIAYPNFVETLVRGASRREDAVLVRAGWDNIDKDGKILNKRYLLSVKSVTAPRTLFWSRCAVLRQALPPLQYIGRPCNDLAAIIWVWSRSVIGRCLPSSLFRHLHLRERDHQWLPCGPRR